MPLYEYKCGNPACEMEFEDLKKVGEDTALCKACGHVANKKMSRFASVIAGGTSNETVDMSIGRAAENRWSMFHDKQSKRHAGRVPQVFEQPKNSSGAYTPVMGLGDSKEKKTRGEYVSALQEHRQERSKKGQGQFDGPGDF